MLHFLFGKPGTGKTYTVSRHFIEESTAGTRPVYLIVPEQTVYTTERRVLPLLPSCAGREYPTSIISFSRLSDVVEDAYGGRMFQSLSRATSLLLMWRNLRELRGLMETYTPSMGEDTSLCRLMLSTVTELSCQAISPAQLEQAARGLAKDSPLRAKLRDLSLVLASYAGLARDICGDNPADRLLRTADSIAAHRYFKDAMVFLDGFTSFTAQEYAVLRHILAQAAEITVTMGCHGREDAGPHMESLRDTVRYLTRLCEEVGQTWEDTHLTQAYRTTSPELLALEKHLWNFHLTPDTRELPEESARGTAIRLISAPTMYEEAHAAVLHIGELHQDGIPYEQIALVVRDTATWRGVLDAALEAAHIPYFLSERRGLCDRPAVRLLLTALRCIRRGYQAEDVISLCKTGLCRVSLSALDNFCDYVETWRIHGARMTDDAPFNMNPDGYTTQISARGKQILADANAVRDTILPPLRALETRLSLAETPEEQCRALFDYLCDMEIKDQLSRKAEALLGLGQHREAGETVRLWQFLTATLADIVNLMPAEEGPLPLDDLTAALSLMFEETDIGAVPAQHNCVLIGAADTSRFENIQALLVLGLCEGEFPRTVSDTGLLSAQDKETLATRGISLNSRAEHLGAEELLFLYRAMTTPSTHLLLFTHTSTPDGTPKFPSVAYGRVRYLFPYLEPIAFSEAMLEENAAPDNAPGSTDSLPSHVYRTPDHAQLDAQGVHAILGDPLWLSHTSLHAFAQCPYRFYADHVLHLRERTVAKMDALSSGNFLHHVMEVYLRNAIDERKQLRYLTEEEIRQSADTIMTDYIQALCGDIQNDGRLLHLFARLRQMVLILVASVQRELEQGAFLPVATEWDTRGRRPEDPQPMVIPLSCSEADPVSGLAADAYAPPLAGHQTVQILMGGKIDRVDVFRKDKVVYVRVIDYKSSRHVFSERKMWEDMNIQLLLYLFTLCAPRNRGLFADEAGELPEAVLPAEALYISPSESSSDGSITPCRSGLILNDASVLEAASEALNTDFLPGVKKDAKTGTLKGASLCAPDHMAALNEEIRSLIQEVGVKIYAGHAERTPCPEACRFCNVRTSCPIADVL